MLVRCSFSDVIIFALFLAGVTGQYDNCTRDLVTIDDGKCNSGNNNADCGFDGGDCCECTCSNDRLYPCGIWGFNCKDPDVLGGRRECINETIVSRCSVDSPQTWFVNDTASATSLAEAVNCSGGIFNVIWTGIIEINRTIEVPTNTTLFLTGEGLGAEVNGGGKTRLLEATCATVHIDKLVLSDGNATYGGAIAAVRSDVFLNQTSCSDNIASSYGGAIYVGRSSTLIWDGQATLKGNHASIGGGAVVVSMDSTAFWGGSTEFVSNAAPGHHGSGGAVYIRDQSMVSWDGVTSFMNNTAGAYGGALYVRANANVSWDKVVYFINNLANLRGGAFYVYKNSIASWDGVTSFLHNTANSRGGGFHVYKKSNVSWDGVTYFIGNTAANMGGALYAYDSSIVSWDGLTSFNNNSVTKSASFGGALCVRAESTVSWNGNTSFVSNMASDGGALVAHDSIVSWHGTTSFFYNRADVHGGALSIDSGSNISWIAETIFLKNTASYGGAIASQGGSTVFWMEETSFTGNNANKGGGAIHAVTGSTISVVGDTYFRINDAGTDGGAVYVYASHDDTIPSYVIVDNDTAVLFHGNRCGANGGGIAVIGDVVTQFDSSMTFSENSAGVAGGAVYVSGVSLGLRFEGARFISNSAVIGGGVYSTGSGNAVTEDNYGAQQENPTTFIECEFVGNEAQKTGGALDSGSGIDLILNTYFVRNTAAIGGALRLVGTASLNGCEFIGNLSDEDEAPGISSDGIISNMSRCSFVDNVFNCQPGYFLDYNETDALFDTVCKGCGTQCTDCVVKRKEPIGCLEELEHSSANGRNASLESLSIESGYWRAANTSINILACYITDACLGGVTGEEGYCRDGYEGPYCSVCSEGFTASLGFVCTKCSENTAGGFAFAVVGAIVFLFVFIAFTSYMLSGKSGDADRGVVARVTRFIPLHTVKIIIVVWQITTQFSTVVNVVFPSVYQELLDKVNILNFDLTWVLSAGCIVDTDFHDKLLLATLGPLLCIAILGGTYAVATHRSCNSEDARKVIRHKHVSMVLLLTFLIYSTVSSILFKTFACDDLDDGKIYLRADYRIECDSSKHIAFEIYTGFMVVLYVVGIPAFYGVLLYGNREGLTKITGREEDEAIKPISDLWKSYRPERFYYEIIECVRRVLLTGALVFIYPNTAAQIAVAMMMVTFFIFISEGLAPHASLWDTWCSRMGHAIVFTTMFLALLLKLDVSGERERSQEVFESVLIAAHACLVLIVVAEAVAMLVAWRQEMREDSEYRLRTCLSCSSPIVGKPRSP